MYCRPGIILGDTQFQGSSGSENRGVPWLVPANLKAVNSWSRIHGKTSADDAVSPIVVYCSTRYVTPVMCLGSTSLSFPDLFSVDLDMGRGREGGTARQMQVVGVRLRA